MAKIKIIGDVHGKFDAYKRLTEKSEYSIQLGDFGFRRDWEKLSRHKIDPTRHKIIPGNHDDYEHLQHDYTFGNDWGLKNFYGLEFFFIRGAYSVDVAYRTQGISWWPEEELEYKFLQMAIEQYADLKPDIVISHECPGDHTGISTIMFQRRWISNRTGLALQEMWNKHHPKLWIFGHWHRSITYDFEGTTFVCLDELDSVDYEIEDGIGNDVDWNIVQIREQVHKLKKRYYKY